MRTVGLAIAAAALACAATTACAEPAASVSAGAEWRLVWSDEFSGDTLDPTKWRARTTPPFHPLGDTDFSDTSRHLRVENGMLKLIARRAPNGRYASAMVETQDRAVWRRGRFEARIKTPRGRGVNAAFWMLHRDPTNEPWPLGGEIDIVEQLGRQPHRAYGTVHFKGDEVIRRGGTIDRWKPFHDDFHVFAVEWTEQGFAWFLDGEKYHEVRMPPSADPDRPGFPFDRPFFLLLSNTIGGRWPGQPGWFARWPKTMEIDWVRVYAIDGGQAAPDRPS